MGVKVGVGICYDIRFSEYALAAVAQGAELLVYPGAFNHVTGPAHWELLQRGRAVDNQVYVATASPSLDPNFSYKAHGHSSIVSPWGNVVAQAGQTDDIIVGNVNMNWVDEVLFFLLFVRLSSHFIYVLCLCRFVPASQFAVKNVPTCI